MIPLLNLLLIFDNHIKISTARFRECKKKRGKEWKENALELGEWNFSEGDPMATLHDTHLHHKVLKMKEWEGNQGSQNQNK